MSLLRLLTAGKSLVGLKEEGNRYRVTSQRLLPKFNLKSNPFGASPEPGVHLPESSNSAEPVRQAAPESPAAVPAATARPDWTSRLRTLWGRQTRASAPVPIPGSLKPVQTELSLESVRVVRNDLSDSDLEIVPAKPSPQLVPQNCASTEPESRWSRMAGRLFAPGKH